MDLGQTFNTFFIFDNNPGADIDREIIWNTILKYYPTLIKDDLCTTDFRKLILEVINDEKFLYKLTKYIPCSLEDIISTMIDMRYDYFDKYVLKKIIPILQEYGKHFDNPDYIKILLAPKNSGIEETTS